MSTLPHLTASRGFARLREISAETLDLSDETLAMVIDGAARFSTERLQPLNRAADRGCRLVDGRVVTPPGFEAAWAAMVAEGWASIDYPVDEGGQGLPFCVQSACQEAFDRGCVAFGMLLTPQRGGLALLSEHAPASVQDEWLPRIVGGDWTTTICVSEPDAGSDVGRIRTSAAPDPDGGWRITGEKCWISFGDHQLTERIGHCVLARTPGAPLGGRGLSLFLVPNWIQDADGRRSANGVHVRRIEEKLGLHGSPTCSIGFENARGELLGKPGRGLAQMFTMIGIMRQAVSVQGLAVAAEASSIAWRYAEERRQGGPAETAPVPIAEHADVQRMLMMLAARVEMLRGVTLDLAIQMDLAAREPDQAARAEAASLAQWLMPIAKSYGAETATWAASEAIQVLGGAGFTREWPVEQHYRDARVFSIYEGTTGIQALDLLHRRLWRDEGAGLAQFSAAMRRDTAELGSELPARRRAERVLGRLERAAATLREREAEVYAAEAAATDFLRLAALAATAWIAVRLAATSVLPSEQQRLKALADYWLAVVDDEAAPLEAAITRGGEPLATAFAAVRGAA